MGVLCIYALCVIRQSSICFSVCIMFARGNKTAASSSSALPRCFLHLVSPLSSSLPCYFTLPRCVLRLVSPSSSSLPCYSALPMLPLLLLTALPHLSRLILVFALFVSASSPLLLHDVCSDDKARATSRCWSR